MRCAGPTARHSWSAYRSVQVRALATGPASPLCGSADPISANEHSPVQIQIVAISPNGAILVNVGFLETNFAFLGKTPDFALAKSGGSRRRFIGLISASTNSGHHHLWASQGLSAAPISRGLRQGLDESRGDSRGAARSERDLQVHETRESPAAMTTQPLVSAANTAVDQRERDVHCGIFGVRPTSPAFV